jgi:hypothetical protein
MTAAQKAKAKKERDAAKAAGMTLQEYRESIGTGTVTTRVKARKSLTPVVFGGIDIGAAGGAAAVTVVLRSVQSKYLDPKLTEWNVAPAIQNFVIPVASLAALHFGKKALAKKSKGMVYAKAALEWTALASLVYAVMRAIGSPVDEAIGGTAFAGAGSMDGAWAVNGKAALQPYYKHQASGGYMSTSAAKRMSGAYVPTSSLNSSLFGAYLRAGK